MVAGENFGEFGKSEAICQSFTHPNLYRKTADSQAKKFTATNEYPALKYLKLVGNMHSKWSASVSSPLGLHSIITTASLVWPHQFTCQPLIDVYS